MSSETSEAKRTVIGMQQQKESAAPAASSAVETGMQEFRVESEPFYLPINDEVRLFEIAYESRLPLMLKGADGVRQDAVSLLHGAPDGDALIHGSLS
ncbi:MAG: hypothetical protein U0411_00520 [Thermodesulfovibrionales bacterium]